MADHRDSVVLAGIAIILISIPAASQNVEISSGEDLEGVIDSKFSDRFRVEFKPGKVVNVLIDKNSKLVVNRSFSRDVKKLQTSQGSVRIVHTSNSIEKTVRTPYGEFKFGIRNGENYSEFTGDEGNRGKAMEIRGNLMERMEERSRELEEKHRIVVQEMLPDISMSISDEPDIEHLNLTNNDERTVDLSGWKAITGDGDSVNYLNLTGSLEPGETRTFFTGDREKMEGFEDAEYLDSNIYSDGVMKVYNSGDREILRTDY